MDAGNNIVKRIEAGEFKNTVPYPKRGSLNWHEARQKYNIGMQAALERFKAVLEKEYGLVGHEKADLLWQKAWDQGHADGLSEVLTYYDDLSELIIPTPSTADLGDTMVTPLTLDSCNLLQVLARIKFRPFDEDDEQAFAGVSYPDALIGEWPGQDILVVLEGPWVVLITESGEQVKYLVTED